MKNKDYSNKLIKAKLWSEVGMEMYENWPDMSCEEIDNAGWSFSRKKNKRKPQKMYSYHWVVGDPQRKGVRGRTTYERFRGETTQK